MNEKKTLQKTMKFVEALWRSTQKMRYYFMKRGRNKKCSKTATKTLWVVSRNGNDRNILAESKPIQMTFSGCLEYSDL